MIHLTWGDINEQADRLTSRWQHKHVSGVYGIPRGGVPVAIMIAQRLGVTVLDEPNEGCLIVDDLIDSGNTFKRYTVCRGKDALFRKGYSPSDVAPLARTMDGWLVFPWENESGDIEDNVTRLLQHIGEDPTREGLLDTPKRFVKALREMTRGYAQDPQSILSTMFTEDYDQMVCLHNIEFSSLCEHHLQPFRGVAAVAYIPNGQVVGLSKLARLVDCYAQRLQVQERMTEQIASTLQNTLDPRGVGVYISAHHSCMGNRGIRKHEGRMVTQKLIGLIKDDPAARAEFMNLAR